MLPKSGSKGRDSELLAWENIWGENRRREGTGTEIGSEKEKSGRGTEIGHSDAKICVYDKTIKNSG